MKWSSTEYVVSIPHSILLKSMRRIFLSLFAELKGTRVRASVSGSRNFWKNKVTLTKLDMSIMPLHPARYYTLYYDSPKTVTTQNSTWRTRPFASPFQRPACGHWWRWMLHASKKEWRTDITKLLIHCDIPMSVCLSPMQLLCTVAAGVAITAARLTRTEKGWRRPPLNKSQWPLKSRSKPKRKEQLCKKNFMWLIFNNTQDCFRSFHINRTVRNN